MSAVSFVFNLIDKMSAPASKIAKAVGETGDAAKKAEKAIAPLPGKLGMVQGALKEAYGDKASAMFGRFANAQANASDMAQLAGVSWKGLKMGAGAASEGAAKLAAGMAAVASVAVASAALVGVAAVGLVAAGASYALDTLRFKQNTEFAWKYTQGSQANAAGTMALAAQLAGELGTSTKEVAAQMQAIFKSGAKGTEARGMIKVLADMKALGAQQDPAALSAAMMAMAKGGALSADVFKPLTELGDGATAKVYESLATKLNIKAKDDDARQQLVDAALAGGALKGQKGIQAYQDAVKNVTGQGAVGGLGKLFNDTTIDGSIEKIKGKFDELMTKLNTGETGKVIVNALQKIAGALDSSTPGGAKLLATFDKMAALGGRLFAKLDFGKMVEGFEMIVGAVDAALGPLSAFADGFSDGFSEAIGPLGQLFGILTEGESSGANFASVLQDVGKAIGTVVGYAATATGVVALLVATLVGAATAVMGAGVAIGAAIIDGMSNGIDSAKAKLVERLNALAALLPASVRKLLGIQSPSKVFTEIGRYTMQGFVAGIDDEEDNVRDRTVSALSPKMAAVGANIGGGAAGGRGAMTVTMNIDASGATDPAAVRQAAEEGATAGTMRLFELLGLEAGAVGPTP